MRLNTGLYKTFLRLEFLNVHYKLDCLFLSGISSPVKYLWVSPGAYSNVEHLKGSLLVKAAALPAKIRLGWKVLPRTYTQA
jgi:hypothetical protein